MDHENGRLLHSSSSYGSTGGNVSGEDNDFRSIHSLHSSGLKSSLSKSISKSIRQMQEKMRPFRASVRDMGGTCTMTNEMFNLVKNLIGAGAFGIPSGFAAIADGSRSNFTLLPAGGIILIMALIFSYYFILVGRVCKMTGSASYREAWDRTAGKSSNVMKQLSFLVPLSVILMAGLGNLAYSMMLADTTHSLAARWGYSISRTASLLLVTVFVLLPLCMVKKLSVLAPFSAVGTGGIAFTVVVMAMRCFDGTYDANKSGKHLGSSIKATPLFVEGAPPPLGANALLLMCMCFMAFFCHYNAPRYYIELKTNTIPRFSQVTNVSFGISALIYFLIGALGYFTFGANTDGFILNNYSQTDDLASACRFAIAIALIFTYPLPFIGTRDGILDLFSIGAEWQTSTNLNALTVGMLSMFTLMAYKFTDLGLVNAVGGAAFGTAVVFVFPSIMFYSAVNQLQGDASYWIKCESVLVMVLMCVGIVMGAIGVMVVVTD
ncbi:hypothetical protein ACHAWX_000869 [Stephanocyclus meneghinianus]